MLIDIHERIKKLNKEQFRKKSISYKKQKKKRKRNTTKSNKKQKITLHSYTHEYNERTLIEDFSTVKCNLKKRKKERKKYMLVSLFTFERISLTRSARLLLVPRAVLKEQYQGDVEVDEVDLMHQFEEGFDRADFRAEFSPSPNLEGPQSQPRDNVSRNFPTVSSSPPRARTNNDGE